MIVRVAGVMVLESFGSHLNRSMGFQCRSLSFPSSLKPSTNDPWKMSSHFFCDGLANATPGNALRFVSLKKIGAGTIGMHVWDSCPWRLIQIDAPLYTLIPPIILKLLFSTTQCCHGKAKLCQSLLEVQRQLPQHDEESLL